MIVQPESWFELGNPNLQTVCVDLAYRLPDGGSPIFTSGDDASRSPPRIIARSFEEWFLELLRQGGREYWFDPDSSTSATPGSRTADTCRARRCAIGSGPMPSGSGPADAGPMNGTSPPGWLSRPDVESIFRHLHHVGAVTSPTNNR